jgi:hypothetical protein
MFYSDSDGFVWNLCCASYHNHCRPGPNPDGIVQGACNANTLSWLLVCVERDNVHGVGFKPHFASLLERGDPMIFYDVSAPENQRQDSPLWCCGAAGSKAESTCEERHFCTRSLQQSDRTFIASAGKTTTRELIGSSLPRGFRCRWWSSHTANRGAREADEDRGRQRMASHGAGPRTECTVLLPSVWRRLVEVAVSESERNPCMFALARSFDSRVGLVLAPRSSSHVQACTMPMAPYMVSYHRIQEFNLDRRP